MSKYSNVVLISFRSHIPEILVVSNWEIFGKSTHRCQNDFRYFFPLIYCCRSGLEKSVTVILIFTSKTIHISQTPLPRLTEILSSFVSSCIQAQLNSFRLEFEYHSHGNRTLQQLLKAVVYVSPKTDKGTSSKLQAPSCVTRFVKTRLPRYRYESCDNTRCHATHVNINERQSMKTTDLFQKLCARWAL